MPSSLIRIDHKQIDEVIYEEILEFYRRFVPTYVKYFASSIYA